jgi:hypothetical protein
MRKPATIFSVNDKKPTPEPCPVPIHPEQVIRRGTIGPTRTNLGLLVVSYHQLAGGGSELITTELHRVFDKTKEATHRPTPDSDSVEFWITCSGCSDFGEYCGNEPLYPYNKKYGCRIGAGCDECEGKGAVLTIAPARPGEPR